MRASRVCVFGGTQSGQFREYTDAAVALGAALACRGLGLVFGAGGTGMMGAVCSGTLDAGGEAIGAIPRELAEREGPRSDLSQLIVVESMHERKARMHHLSDAFIALPGGFGTLEELFEVLTWVQLGIHAKPIIILNLLGYYDPLVSLLEHLNGEGFAPAASDGLLHVASSVDEVLDHLRVLQPA
ncbi:TIGR00730 family Rossman fold protein [Phytoactinopolyspora endophytica]|uniref:LOG family protein n=1 Tax=Phytoactinopolyspora endophytica TaxID=1642495 RepID=UPI00101CA4D8|nr:TIGR00730 family Rossman fold protein [Phytoactinopolyspora endophytica]